MKRISPMEIRCGSVVVRIYFQKKAGVYTVAYYEEGQRKRASYCDLVVARKEAEIIAERLSRNNGSSLTLRDLDLAVYKTARQHLDCIGTRLDIAASEYSQALSMLEGRGTLLEAVRYFKNTCAGDIVPIRTRALVDDLIKAREANHASKRHIKDLESRLNRFARTFQCDVHTIRPAQVQDFLLGLNLSPRSMNNFRTAISNLFSHAKLRSHAPKDFDPLEDIPWAKETEGEIEIFSPDELKLILSVVRMFRPKISLDSAQSQVHDRQAPRSAVTFLAVNGDGCLKLPSA